MADKVLGAFALSRDFSKRLFTALGILLEVQRVRYNSPTAKVQREELKLAGKELGAALSDWRKFVEVLSTVADKFKFGPSELSVISRVNQMLLDSMERLGGGSGKLVLLIFIAVWKTTYVVLRTAIQLLVAAIRALSGMGQEATQLLTDYLHAQISGFGQQQRTGGFFGSRNAPPSIRKAVLYLLSGALLVGIPVAILLRFILPAIMAVLMWFYNTATAMGSVVLPIA